MTGSFRPHVLSEYSLIADRKRGTLIGPDGAIAYHALNALVAANRGSVPR